MSPSCGGVTPSPANRRSVRVIHRLRNSEIGEANPTLFLSITSLINRHQPQIISRERKRERNTEPVGRLRGGDGGWGRKQKKKETQDDRKKGGKKNDHHCLYKSK